MLKRKASPKGTRKKAVKDTEKAQENIAAKSGDMGVTPEERYQLIAKAAYLRAERRSFVPGDELKDWLEAEAEVDGMLGQKAADSQSPDA